MSTGLPWDNSKWSPQDTQVMVWYLHYLMLRATNHSYPTLRTTSNTGRPGSHFKLLMQKAGRGCHPLVTSMDRDGASSQGPRAVDATSAAYNSTTGSCDPYHTCM